VTILDTVDSMTDIDLATVHPLAPAGAPGTEVPGAIFRYWNTEDGPRYGAQRCRRSTAGTPGSSAPARTLTSFQQLRRAGLIEAHREGCWLCTGCGGAAGGAPCEH